MWYFRSPEIVFGEDALDRLTMLSGQQAVIVTDRTMVRLGHVNRVVEKLQAAGISCRIFSDVDGEPTLPVIQAGAEVMNTESPDWIVGLGGGSAMDAAKAMWALYENPDLDVLSINPFEPLTVRRKARLVAISATSGTGAEATWAVVLTDPADRRKIAIGAPELLPDIAIVDPSLAATMPPQLAADTGMDALTHAIEGFTSTWSNDFADGLCLHAARLIFTCLPRSVADPGDSEARAKMHYAAAIAGLGFINSMCSLAHAMGHSLGAVFHLPHGRAVGLALPYTIQFTAHGDAPTRYPELAALLGLPASTPAESAASLVSAVRNLARQIGQPLTIAEALDISRQEFEKHLDVLVDHTENDSQFVTAPRLPSTEEVRRLFLAAFDGEEVGW
ncbi:MAG: iron-containing alcohol dehydrogenase [Chloroflexi bacterium]|nr:MAG: iron-containing alcohol dehydrogenase [Chloroflexota bacterium]